MANFSSLFKNKKKWAYYSALFSVAVVTLVVLVVIGTGQTGSKISIEVKKPQNSGFFPRAAVSTDGAPCAAVGRQILEANGSAVDAAIAALLCDGLTNAHSMGIGGGCVMTIWDSKTKTAHALISREWAPSNASEDMFGGNGTLSQTGGLSIAVPGEIMGYWEAHQKFGRLPWKDLFAPAIKMCNEGIVINKPLADALKSKRSEIRNNPGLREIFWNEMTNEVYQLGDVHRRPTIAKTFQRIAENGVHEFYEGETARMLVEDIQKEGGIVTLEDMKNYRAKWYQPFNSSLESFGIDIFTTPSPSSGPLMAFILNVLETFGKVNPGKSFTKWRESDRVTTAHRIIEAYKHAYAKRTIMGDPDFLQDTENFVELMKNISSQAFAEYIHDKIFDNMTFPLDYYGAEVYTGDDSGTAHVSIVAPDGDAVAVTSTVNLYFGSKVRSQQTGIILNDEMDDFSAPNITNVYGVPPSPNNYIRPLKRPLSSMCPAVFIDRETQTVRLVTGASGGTRITTAVAWVAMLNIMFNETLEAAVSSKRLHNQLFPMQVMTEKDFPEDIVSGLQKIGHNVSYVAGFASVVSISRANGCWNACYDPRKIGEVDGF